MTNHTFPRTPFATPLARPGTATARRIQRIVRFPKMKRTPAVLLVLAALAVVLCGNLAACQSEEAPPPSGTALNDSGENQTPPTDTLPPPTQTLSPPREDVYQGSGALVASVPLNVAGERTVTVELYGASASPENPSYYAIDELQVWEETQLLQTIRTAELSYDGDYLFEGLFDHQSEGPVGSPDRQDINFDGSQDLGLLAAEGYPHNLPYCYFLWDEAANRLSTQPLVLFGPVTLDAENQRIQEYVKDGPSSYHNYYRFNSDGSLERLRSAPVQSLASRVFRTELEQIYSQRLYPDGSGVAEPWADMTSLDFAVIDIDSDGAEELLVRDTDTITAGMRTEIYGYDPASGQLYTQFIEFPTMEFYDNGAVVAYISHNQGHAGRFWPYRLYRYDWEMDRYVMVGFANALDREALAAAELDLSSFPADVDKDGDGLVYYLTEEPYGDADPVDGEAYQAWRDVWLSGASQLDLPWQALTPENIRAVFPD